MRTEIKICGLSKREEIDAVMEAGGDLVGFVLFEKSPRNVSLGHAAALAGRTCGKLGVVPLTVNASDELVARIAEDLRPDLIQLHGSESVERVREIRSRWNLRVMKAIGVAGPKDLEAARAYAPFVERLLLDAKPPKDATRPGGNGAPFDWSLLDGFDPGVPWMLSGGLTPETVTEALSRTAASGIDVSSGVESAPGVKDLGRIRSFIGAVRDADRHGRPLAAAALARSLRVREPANPTTASGSRAA
ncbi:phosphoribosylanthranilate isomerase [Faunimonas pinastri]|uniref:N-(5'-phosphoribosyl)anthranilate isomerase n=1 Tax=Faunimonas pinastri TaxID=1855383 RepID=A0A1H9GIM9_9HYPH|nr:phosphoribosylanthranilate isomerase [Faunimonas pinastri]SEQ49962.1 phosphoribosylanthranilate isomerase [Faunimonas pinastri]